MQLLTAAQGYFDPRTEANAFLHLWTLSVEEQFYLVFPVLLLVASRSKATRVVLAASALLSLGLAGVLTVGLVPGIAGSANRIAFYSAPTRAWEFLVGSLLALMLTGRWRPSPRFSDALTIAGGLALLVALTVFDESTSFPWPLGVVPVIATAALVVAGTVTDGRGTRLLASGPARWLGDRSYGWYLWHWPLIVFSRALFPGQGWAPPLAALVALGPTVVSHRWLEQPIRHGEPRLRPTFALGVVCVVGPLTAVATIAPQGRAWDANPTLKAMNAQLGRHLDAVRGCVDNGVEPPRPDRCVWVGESGAAGSDRVVLVGDSNAGHLSEGFVEAAGRGRFEARIVTRTGCPFADLEIRRDGQVDRGCRRFYEEQMTVLLQTRPSAVVLASAADLRVVDPTSQFRGGVNDGWAGDIDSKLRVWNLALSRTVTRLGDLGIGVVVVTPVPRFTGWQPLGECARLRILVDEAGCGADRPRGQTLPVGTRFREVEDQVAESAERATVLDLAPALCPGETCHTFVNGRWVFRDESHITVATSRAVAPELVRAIESVVGR